MNVVVSNEDVVRTLERIARLLEIRGENEFKVRAYRQAAAQLENILTPLRDIAGADGGLQSIDGVGNAIAEKLTELLETGRLTFLENLEAEVPPTLISVCELPGVGPRTANLLWKEAGITTIEELDHAARSGGLSGLPRLGQKSVEKIIAGLDAREMHGAPQRRPRERVAGLAEALTATLRSLDDAERVEIAGSYRRGAATLKDLDFVVATGNPAGVLTAFAALPQVERVVVKGDTKCSIEADGGFQVDCRAVATEAFGAAWQYFTGSKAHNVKLRGRALRLGMTLNEYGVFRTETGERLAGETEEAVYAVLGLDWISPDQREDRGEVEAALRDRVAQEVP